MSASIEKIGAKTDMIIKALVDELQLSFAPILLAMSGETFIPMR